MVNQRHAERRRAREELQLPSVDIEIGRGNVGCTGLKPALREPAVSLLLEGETTVREDMDLCNLFSDDDVARLLALLRLKDTVKTMPPSLLLSPSSAHTVG